MLVFDNLTKKPALKEMSEATLIDYIALMKPGVVLLVAFTGLTGMVAAPGTLNLWITLIGVICIIAGSGAAGSLNMWYDVDIDSLMKRTAMRPLPSGRLHPDTARDFGLVLAFFSVLTLGVFVNWLSAILLAGAIFFYSVIYTIWLKRRTPQNIVIGGAAGALPPVIGWAITSSEVSLESFLLFALIFCWTPPHFWALALVRSDDYERAGLPMMPNVYGWKTTKRNIMFYACLTACVGILPSILGFSGIFYGISSVFLGLGFVWYSWKVFFSQEEAETLKFSKTLFTYSLIYLFGMFFFYLLDVFIERISIL